MIVCGWCNAETDLGRCTACGRDPALPWAQRALEPPVVTVAARHRRLLAEATVAIRAEGSEPTIDRLAERLEVDPRTVRRWRALSG